MYYFQRSPVVVPIDYSDASLRALRVALTIAQSPEDVTVVYAAPNMDLIVPGQLYGGLLTPDEIQQADLKRLNEWLAEHDIDLKVKRDVLIGDPGTCIADYQKDKKARLIVLPSHGRHGLKRLLLGSVAERIVRHCDCSVLVLKYEPSDSDHRIAEAWIPRKRVVVPIDFSMSSPASIKVALELVENRPDVDVINVVPILDHIYGGFLSSLPDGVQNDKSRRDERQQYLERYLAERDFDVVRAHAISGDPGTVIADYAMQNNADLIVIPSHGYSGVNRLVLGSVAERVLRHASCPVLVMRRLDAR